MKRSDGYLPRIVEYWTVQGARAKPFSEPGDAGTWFLDWMGCLIGLLLGGVSATQTAFFTPIADVIDDIERETGCKVSLCTM